MEPNRRPLNILWLKSGPLHPPDSGGKIRTYEMLRMLKKQHWVTYMALYPDTVDQSAKGLAGEYSTKQVWIPWRETSKRSPALAAELAANLFSTLPYGIGKYTSRSMRQRVLEADRAGEFDLIVCDFLFPAINVFNGHGNLRTPSLLFQHNVESLIWKRRFETAGNLAAKNYFRQQWQRLWKYEKEASQRFDGVVAVSDADCELMRTEYGLTNVLGSVPAGVDVTYFGSVQRDPKPHHIAFLGSMDWAPNVDAVRYFVDAVWPLLKTTVPDVTLTIIGRNPPRWMEQLAQEDPAIEVTGTVPDVRPFLAKAQALVVPLRVGGGTRIKIFEALAAGIPVISTSIGMEGLPLTNREHILVADSATEFAAATAEALTDPDLADRISRNAAKLVRERYGWEAAANVFSGYCYQVAGK